MEWSFMSSFSDVSQRHHNVELCLILNNISIHSINYHAKQYLFHHILNKTLRQYFPVDFLFVNQRNSCLNSGA